MASGTGGGSCTRSRGGWGGAVRRRGPGGARQAASDRVPRSHERDGIAVPAHAFQFSTGISINFIVGCVCRALRVNGVRDDGDSAAGLLHAHRCRGAAVEQALQHLHVFLRAGRHADASSKAC
jgi:hypothetical protein